MSPSTAEPQLRSEPRSTAIASSRRTPDPGPQRLPDDRDSHVDARTVGHDWVLRLDTDAWVLTTPSGTRRQKLNDAPALQLDRLEAGTPGRRVQLRVVLGDGWLRYLVLKWPQGVTRRAEREAYLVHRFREVHGVGAPEWVLVSDRDAVSFPRLACAAPASLIGAVQAFADSRQVRLASVTGDFVDRFNALQAGFNEPAGSYGALAHVRGGRITVGLWRDAMWQAVRSLPLAEDGGGADVRRMLETWCAASGGRNGTASGMPTGVLYASGTGAAAPAGWRFEQRGGAA